MGKEFIRLLTIPPSVHIRFPQCQRATGQYPLVKIVVMYLYIPGGTSINLDSYPREKIGYLLLRNRRRHETLEANNPLRPEIIGHTGFFTPNQVNGMQQLFAGDLPFTHPVIDVIRQIHVDYFPGDTTRGVRTFRHNKNGNVESVRYGF